MHALRSVFLELWEKMPIHVGRDSDGGMVECFLHRRERNRPGEPAFDFRRPSRRCYDPIVTIDAMVSSNRQFAGQYVPQDVKAKPQRQLALLLCMDARIDPFAAFGLKTGDAHILRNAGGRIADAVRSLVISQSQLGTRAVAIVHHTDCGMMTFRDDDIRATLRTDLGVDASHVAFLPFRDLEESVRDDIAFYRQQPLLRQDIPVRGFVFDVSTGLLREVSARP